MSASDELRLAWQAHREGRAGRRDALLTLAVASGYPQGAPWAGAVRDYLVAAHPGHLFSGSHHVDESLADRRVIAGLKKLREVFPTARVRSLVRRDDVLRGPYSGTRGAIRYLVDDLLAPSRGHSRGPLKLGATGATGPAAAPPVSAEPSTPDPIVAYYLNVLLAIAMLCATVVAESTDGKRAA